MGGTAVSIWNKLKEKFKDLVIEIIGKREKIKPEPIPVPKDPTIKDK